MHSPTPHQTPPWLVPPESLTLQKGEVHVWRGIVDIPSSRLQVYKETLSGEELQRAQRFRFPQHHIRFIAARGILRSLLGQYLDLSPQEIELGIGTHGKPFVKNPVARTLYFNVSHSQKIALFAFSHDSEVGIDVEGSRACPDYQSLAKRVMSAQEQQWFHGLPASKQKAAFLTCWTRKEAFVKAKGAGLTFPIRDLTVTFLPHQPASIVKIEDPVLDSRTWTMYPVYPRISYAAALVVAGQPQTVKYWNVRGWKSQPRVTQIA